MTDQPSVLLEIGEKYSDLFTVYLDSRDYNDLAWLHDIKIKRYFMASQRVQDGAVMEMNVDRRRTMFSLSKLLFFAGVPQQQQHQQLLQYQQQQLQVEDDDAVDPEGLKKYIGRNNEELEMATIQAVVADDWESQVGALASIDEQARAIVDTFESPVLGEQPMLREVGKCLGQELLQQEGNYRRRVCVLFFFFTHQHTRFTLHFQHRLYSDPPDLF